MCHAGVPRGLEVFRKGEERKRGKGEDEEHESMKHQGKKGKTLNDETRDEDADKRPERCTRTEKLGEKRNENKERVERELWER